MNEDQRDALREITDEQWKAIVVYSRSILSKMEKQVLTCDITKGSRAMVLAKARLDGGSCIITGLEAARDRAHKEN